MKVAQNAELQGYLKKKGDITVTSLWRTRWFVLKNRFLYYFKTPQVLGLSFSCCLHFQLLTLGMWEKTQHPTSAGAIPLSKSSVKMVDEESKERDNQHEFSFEIVTNHRYGCCG